MRAVQVSPLVSRVLRDFLLSCLLIFLLVTVVTLALDYNVRVNRWQAHVEEVLLYSQEPLARALWNFDKAQLQSNLEALVRVEEIQKAEVYDDRGQLFASAAKLGGQQAIEATLSRPIVASQKAQPIGSLRLYIANHMARERFWRSAYQGILAEFAEIVTVGAVLLFLLHRNVTQYLIKIARSVAKLELQKGLQPIDLERGGHEFDELDEVVNAINNFQREIISERSTLEELELKSRNLSAEVARMGRVATVQSLTSTIAHELNQPLGAILSNAETIELAMLDKLAADDPLREVLADIAAEARRAGDIIRNLRKLIEKRDANLTVLSLNAVVNEVVDLARLDARWEAIRIETDLADPLPDIVGSDVQLQQVILNLVVNARDAIRQSQVAHGVITIRTRIDDVRWVRLSVIDNGPGVPPEKISEILQPFFTTKEGGTGMGLWIAQMIIEQHGGKLEVTNLSGGGACFSFALPVQPL